MEMETDKTTLLPQCLRQCNTKSRILIQIPVIIVVGLGGGVVPPVEVAVAVGEVWPARNLLCALPLKYAYGNDAM